MDCNQVKVPCSDESPPCDHISFLPEDMLLNILMLLPLVEAVRTCVLSRRWRHVWTRLPRLKFDDAEEEEVPDFGDLIAGVIRGYSTDVVVPDVFISVRCHQQYLFNEAISIAESAFLAAPRATSKFVFFVSPYAVMPEWAESEDEEEGELLARPLQMPCFPTVKVLSFTFPWVELRMPKTGIFARLTTLRLSGIRFTDDGEDFNDALSRRCPCIQDVDLYKIRGLKLLSLVSKSLLRVRLVLVMDLERLLLVAKNLSAMQVTKCFTLSSAPTWMQLYLPKLQQLHWEDRCPDVIHRLNLPTQLLKLTVIELSLVYLIACDGLQSHFTRILQAFERVGVLRLQIPIAPDSVEQKNLINNVNIPFYWELELIVKKNGHMFGPTILKLLDRRNCFRKLSLQIVNAEEDENIIPPCTSNCRCREMQNLKVDKITLRYLKWLVIKRFNGTEEETNFLYTILRNAKELRKVCIVFSKDVQAPKMFLYHIYKLSPSSCSFEFSTA